MKKLVLVLSLLFVFSAYANSSTILTNEKAENTFESVVTLSKVTNYDLNVLIFVMGDKELNEKPEFDVDSLVCSALAVSWAQSNGFVPGTRDWRLAVWNYYHGCMRHQR